MRAVVFLLGLAFCAGASAQERRNAFDDPFLQVTSALPGCPVPRPPGFTGEEVRREAHVRAQHGSTSGWTGVSTPPRSGSWGERRLVTLMGCVRTREQAEQMEKAVLLVDDVMGVVNFLQVGTTARPKYPLR